jgi:membrane fusion protein, copper/silver efflux system
MRRAFLGLILLGFGVATGAGGYWLSRDGVGMSSGSDAITATEAAAAERKVLYYRDPMDKPYYSAEPKKDSMGMDYIPVYEGEDESASRSSPPTALVPGGKGRILYYRNPMGLPDTSPVPKKDSMGMDYIPVTEGEETDDAGTVKISPDRVQKLGVQTAPVEPRVLTRTIRAVGTVQADERRLYVVNTKFEGWIQKLYVNATGQTVTRGQPLMEIYAPELVVAEREYLLAWRSLQDMAGAATEIRSSARQLAEAALQRLHNWDISADQIKRLQSTGTVTRTLTLRAPADGTVMEKMAVEGMHFTAGDPLYRIADLSTVWVNADVFEQDIGALRDGQEAKIEVNAYPGAAFSGRVDFIYPTVSQETRTGKVRIVVRNTDGRLKIGMYANVAFETGIGDRPVLAVPDSAVIDSGTRQVVLIERGGGKFEPREVKLGSHADGFYEIRQGLAAGERVVVSANFLIDAESNLRAALKGFTPPDSAGGKPQPPPTPEGGKP